MSRIGKKPIPVGQAKVNIAGQRVTVEGPKGKLEMDLRPRISVEQKDGNLVVHARPARSRPLNASLLLPHRETRAGAARGPGRLAERDPCPGPEPQEGHGPAE